MSTEITTVHQAQPLSAWESLKEQSEIALASRYLPKPIQTREQAITIAMAGMELGIPPMTAFRLIDLVEGRISMRAELLLALALRKIPGFRLEVVKQDHQGCAVRYWRPGMETLSTAYAFTWDDATRAGLTAKQNWQRYPAAMLRARAISAALRVGAPDATLGIPTTEELMDGALDFDPAASPSSSPSAPAATPNDALKDRLRAQAPAAPALAWPDAPAQVAPPAAPKPARKPKPEPAAAPIQATVERVVSTPFGPATQTVPAESAPGSAAIVDAELDRGDSPEGY